MYTRRKFCVTDGGHKSKERPRRSGIAQGCPLSPLLFAMAMTVVMRDAVELLDEQSKVSFKSGILSILLYADDALVYGRYQRDVQNLLNAVATAGGQVGMGLHWDKFQ
eukprot:1136884-Pyramimonas_sp.AAC.1